MSVLLPHVQETFLWKYSYHHSINIFKVCAAHHHIWFLTGNFHVLPLKAAPYNHAAYRFHGTEYWVCLQTQTVSTCVKSTPKCKTNEKRYDVEFPQQIKVSCFDKQLWIGLHTAWEFHSHTIYRYVLIYYLSRSHITYHPCYHNLETY